MTSKAKYLLDKTMDGLRSAVGETCFGCGGDGTVQPANGAPSQTCPLCEGHGVVIPDELGMLVMFNVACAFIGAARSSIHAQNPLEAAEYLDFFVAFHTAMAEQFLQTATDEERERARQFAQDMESGVKASVEKSKASSRLKVEGSPLSHSELIALGIIGSDTASE